MGLLDRLKLPNINAQRFRMNLAINAARVVVEKEVWPLLDQIGEQRFHKLIDTGQPFLSEIPYQRMPEKWQEWISAAPQYKFMTVGLDENIVLMLLPHWFQVLVQRDDKSWNWFLNECLWIRSIFGDEEQIPEAPPPPPPSRYIPAQ